MDLIPGKENPTREEVEDYVKNAPLDELNKKVSELNKKQDVLHPTEEFFIEEYDKRIQTGGRRRSKKRPTARRRRSSKARKSRKSRKARTTRRK